MGLYVVLMDARLNVHFLLLAQKKMDEKKRASVRSQHTAGTKLASGPPIPVWHRWGEHDR